jgi:hypothetical protein
MKTTAVIATMFVAILVCITTTAFAFIAIQPVSNLLAVLVLLAGSLTSFVVPMLASAKVDDMLD